MSTVKFVPLSVTGELTVISHHEHEFKGSYEIERHLYGAQGLQAGSWVAGKTVFGSIKVNGVSVECYTRPAFAYLSYCSRVQESRSDQYVSRQHYWCGLGREFMGDIGCAFKISAGVNRANSLSGIVTDLPAHVLWGEPSEHVRDVYLNGSAAYLIYQVNIAYAHCLLANKISKELQGAFCDVGGQQVLVSATATSSLVAVDESQAVELAGWPLIKQAVLERAGQGVLQFDYAARDVPFYRYK